MKILLVEDDKVVGSLVKNLFEKSNFSVDIATTGFGGIEQGFKNTYDCIILDLGLPDVDGLEICKKLRSGNINTPIIILSSYDATNIKVSGLDFGADDYLTKPFDNLELKARTEALIRRYKSQRLQESYKYRELETNVVSRKFFVNDKEVELTNNEFDILQYLIKNPERIISIEELSHSIWGDSFDKQTNYINVYMSYIRKKIKQHTDVNYIKTIRKRGFELNDK